MTDQEFFEYKPTPEEEAQMKVDMEAAIEAELEYWKEVSKYNNRVFNAIKSQLGEKYLKAVLDCLEESEAGGKLEIVPRPTWRKQEEDWDEFDHIYVDQYIDGGMTGDHFEGYVYIPLKKNKYLKSHYSM